MNYLLALGIDFPPVGQFLNIRDPPVVFPVLIPLFSVLIAVPIDPEDVR